MREKLFPELTTRRTRVAMAGDFQRGLDVGTYTGRHLPPRPSALGCPYCHEPMLEAQPLEPPGRVVRIVRRLKSAAGMQRADVIVHLIPETHRVVGCRACHEVFTTPSGPEAR